MRQPAVSVRQFLTALVMFIVVMVVGTVGFMLISDESVFDAFYRSAITVYTAGVVDPPTTDGEKALTLVLVVLGVAIFLYVFGLLIELVVSGTVTGGLQRRRMRRLVDGVHSHYIICGYGRVGRRIGREFRESGMPYIVVDFREDAVGAARERDDLLVEGSGTEDRYLREAGIESARGLIASADSDVDNLYITLSARAVRPDLLIVARASDEAAAKKLRMAGADRVVQPYSTAGREMATLMLKPQVAAFLEAYAIGGESDMEFEEIIVPEDCPHVGKSIGELRVREKTGALIIAIRKDDRFDTTPDADVIFETGDVVIGVGTDEELRALADLLGSAQPAVR